MIVEKRNIKKHLFICTNTKDGRECCAEKDSMTLLKSLKQKLRDNNQYEDIRVTASGCLGPCSQGISAVLFPENEVLTQLKLSDVDELYQLLTK